MINAAGIIFRSPQGRVLLLRRSDTEDWDYPGGKCRENETQRQAAVREAYEETAYRAGHAGNFLCRRVRNGVDYTTFLHDCDDEFTPKLSREHTDYMWVQPRLALTDSIKARADAYGAYQAGLQGGGGGGTSGGGFPAGAMMRAWEEHKHPRGGDPENKGRFSKGHGAPGGEEPPAQARQEPVQAPAQQQAQQPQAQPKPAPAAPQAAPQAAPAPSFNPAKPADFIAARNKSSRAGFMSELKPEDLTNHTLLMNQEGTVGIAVSPEGDIQNIFNNGGPKGSGAYAITQAIQAGGRTLDCYDGFLPDFYRQFGFVETSRMKFNPEFAHGWNLEKQGTPDVVFMSWQGFPEGDATKAIERGMDKSQSGWVTNEVSEDYGDDWDAAKSASREQAEQSAPAEPGRAGGHPGDGKPPGAQAEPAGGQPSAGAGEAGGGHLGQGAAAEGAEHRHSTRIPTAKPKKGQEAADFHGGSSRGQLEPDLASLESTPDQYHKVANVIRGYGKSFLNIPPGATDKQVIDGFVEHLTDNLMALYNKQDKDYRQRSRKWYDGANKIAHRLGKKYGLKPDVMAAVIATQSPQKDWDSNVKLGESIARIMTKEKDVKVEGKLANRMNKVMEAYADKCDKEAEKYETPNKEGKTRPKAAANARKSAALTRQRMAEFQGKSFSDMSKEGNQQAWFLRFYEQATSKDRRFHIYSPEGDELVGQFGKTDTGKDASYSWSGFAVIQNGVDSINHPDRISQNLGSQHKVRNFYNNIISPNYGKDVTVDTHAIAAALLQPLGSKSPLVGEGLGGGGPGSAETGNQGLYPLYYTAYQKAAEQAGVLPREMQSIAWEALRGLYSASSKRDEKVIEHANNTWADYRKTGDRKAAQRRILDRGIEPPRWAKGGH